MGERREKKEEIVARSRLRLEKRRERGHIDPETLPKGKNKAAPSVRCQLRQARKEKKEKKGGEQFAVLLGQLYCCGGETWALEGGEQQVPRDRGERRGGWERDPNAPRRQERLTEFGLKGGKNEKGRRGFMAILQSHKGKKAPKRMRAREGCIIPRV